MKGKIIRIGLLAFMLAYAISPVDAAPGPIDDAIVLLGGTLVSLAMKRKQNKDE